MTDLLPHLPPVKGMSTALVASVRRAVEAEARRVYDGGRVLPGDHRDVARSMLALSARRLLYTFADVDMLQRMTVDLFAEERRIGRILNFIEDFAPDDAPKWRSAWRVAFHWRKSVEARKIELINMTAAELAREQDRVAAARDVETELKRLT